LPAQVESTKAELAHQQKNLADAQAAKAAAEQQLDRLTQHLDDTEAQLQDAK
jgi:predicted  nucleic acid-binding Zn-ribbon protein